MIPNLCLYINCNVTRLSSTKHTKLGTYTVILHIKFNYLTDKATTKKLVSYNNYSFLNDEL